MPASAVASVAESETWARIKALIGELEPWVLRRQMDVTAVAAPTFYEGLRAEWMLRHWREQGLTAELDEVGNVIAGLPGRDPSLPALALSAHLDTAFPPGTLPQPECRDGRVWAPGIGDNGAGLAALMLVARALVEAGVELRRTVYFLANVGEEGEGDLKGMRHFFSPASRYADQISHTLVVDGPGDDRITAHALPSLRLRLIFQGPGGHSWSNRGRASAVHAAVRTGAALLAQLDPHDASQGCNLGWVQGGSAVNAIAAEAVLKLDLRAERQRGIQRLESAVRRAAALGIEQENNAARNGAVQVQIETIGERPGGELAADSPLLSTVLAADRVLGLKAQIERASTDANIPIAQGRDALRVGAGGSGGGIHTLQEWYDPTGREAALRRILLVTLALAEARLV